MKIHFSCGRFNASVVFLLGAMLLVGCGANIRLVGVPAYLVDRNPEDWKQMGEAWPWMAFVIMNPNSGPGAAKDPTYTPPVGQLKCIEKQKPGSDFPTTGGDQAVYDYLLKCMKQAAHAFPARYGYVATTQGTKPLSAIQDEIKQYYADYPVNGIFLDELPQTAPTTDLEDIRTYVSLTAWCKEKGPYCTAQHASLKCTCAVIVENTIEIIEHTFDPPVAVYTDTLICNPGTTTDSSYMNSCDVLVDFEGTYNAYLKYKQPSWVTGYSSARFWHIVNAATTAKQMRKAVNLSQKRHVFWIYVTHVPHHPHYNMLTKYWNDLLLEILK